MSDDTIVNAEALNRIEQLERDLAIVVRALFNGRQKSDGYWSPDLQRIADRHKNS